MGNKVESTFLSVLKMQIGIKNAVLLDCVSHSYSGVLNKLGGSTVLKVQIQASKLETLPHEGRKSGGEQVSISQEWVIIHHQHLATQAGTRKGSGYLSQQRQSTHTHTQNQFV